MAVNAAVDSGLNLHVQQFKTDSTLRTGGLIDAYEFKDQSGTQVTIPK